MPRLDEDKQKVAMLSMKLASLQSNLSEYAQRARQAEEMVGLLSANWDHDKVGMILAKHIEERAQERAIHQQNLIQTTITALTSALKSDDYDQMRQIVNTVAKELTTATMNLHQLLIKEEKLKQRSQNGTPARH